ncbi:MAG: C40 family peptidase [Candidatus Taylorbacteria bacterium]|nr:C40 family peptidase [Candidatus Taylorbacteria bacterium]
MFFRAVGNRCAVCLNKLGLPFPDDELLPRLLDLGFKPIGVDIIELARSCIGRSLYRRGARPDAAPDIVDCSSFVKWLYGQRGIWLPRRSIQQREHGEVIQPSEIEKDDLVFTSGRIDYFDKDPTDGVGHVGIATGEGTIVHAANKKVNVVETALERFLDGEWRGARRLLRKGAEVLTLEVPEERFVETADDIRWIVLQSLPVPA